MILADYHCHTSFSDDSESSPSEQAAAAVAAGMKYLCITDHIDLDYPDGSFQLDADAYYPAMQKLKKEFEGRLDIRIGAELGLQPHLLKEVTAFSQQKPWDFLIGSTHVVDHVDPYFPEYWDAHDQQQGIRIYFEETLRNIQIFDCFDVYGHIDYIIRYAPGQNLNYSWKNYSDVLDEILRTLIAKGKGIECNTAGFKYGLGHPNPEEPLLKRYRELGGELLTIGSDGHKPEHVAYDFAKIPALLKDCGFRYYTIFKDRKAEMLPL